MAKKTKAPKSSVAQLAQLRKAIDEIELTQKRFQKGIVGVRLSQKALKLLRETKAHLSQAESSLCDLLKAQEHGRSPRTGKGAVPVGRNDVDGAMPPLPRPHSSKRRVGSRKRVSALKTDKAIIANSGKEFFHDHELPH